MNLLQQLSGDLEALATSVSPGVVGVAQRGGQGSGLVLAPDGYVLTNAHVVAGGRRMTVHLAGEQFRAELVGHDPPTDLAVLRVDAGAPLHPLPMAADLPGVGSLVLALGNPLRLEGSVSLGLVSALERSLPAREGVLEGLIQTDAAINPGNSGGPLLSAWGEVVGVNTAIILGAQGIGFAIPAPTARWVAGLLIQRGEIRRRYLGVGARGEALTPALARQAGQARGVRVLEVRPDSPAQAAGLRAGDLLLTADQQQVAGVNDLQRALVLGGSEVGLDLWRAQERTQVTVRPVFPQAA